MFEAQERAKDPDGLTKARAVQDAKERHIEELRAAEEKCARTF